MASLQHLSNWLRHTSLGWTLATTALFASSGSALAATDLKVVGSWSSLALHQDFEKPFWTKTLPEASDGQFNVQMTTFDQMGIASSDVFRYLSNGLFDVGMTSADYVVSDAPELEGLDLPMMAPDVDTAHRVANAYMPIAQRTMNQRFDSHALAIVPYPEQIVFCNTPIKGLADLKGKKVRASGRSTGEFLQAIGANSVNLAFNEVPGAMERGVIDCAVTGSLSGYSAGWQDVSSYLMPLPIGGWDYVLTAINNKRWNALSKQQQQLLTEQIQQNFVKPVWENAHTETQQGIACLTGQGGQCEHGKPASMTLVEPSKADEQHAREALGDHVLPAWAARVDAPTRKAWNNQVGPIVDLKVPTP
ncbi:TRAP transporter substrate-binding protein [Kushneria phosphatilytica]|uniref:TRAP transporter substrate-binding protein n=1 Tax=Kushneria phosphatilytica TaxID=657387 RepID=A0A1S1NWX2_9GAMM|nr:TRAP transporter substrate-binding protein [Kushneria phosphatilytica]OHV12756.1 C4-dicarboxylate ABC transporter substrate-binding protein [Kushneria phosphatilytica]QEL10597.1 TRAP transporter substrate-binding protein [Kushneria phosphatilytica]